MMKSIGGPQPYPFIGNLLDLRDEIPIRGLGHLADKYGPIYKLTVRGRVIVVISSVRLLEEACDESRFRKVLASGLERVKRPGHSGLFTAPSEVDQDWILAHRVLMPAFGPFAVQDMFNEMHDIASQLILKWARMGSDYRIPVTDDFTRLTLDTIALCAMGYRFNSFYQDEMHPFVQAMVRTLTAGNGPSSLFDIFQSLSGSKKTGLEADQKLMSDVGDKLVQARRDNPEDCKNKKDLLNSMINGKDPKTGEKMSDGLIAANMITFLIAGHETTSGLLSFAFVNLLKHPAAYRKAQEEVDKVLGRGKMKVEHLKELKYLNAILRETLRLTPTVPAFVRKSREVKTGAICPLGGYEMSPEWDIVALLTKTNRDPEIYGEDADDFKPERMLDGRFEKLPQAAWKPFGTGSRACIGRAFAWQEALLITALILQNFDTNLDDPSYELRIKQTMTFKPIDFFMRAKLRAGLSATALQANILSALSSSDPDPLVQASVQNGDPQSKRPPLLILYGSNTGTCQRLAQKLDAEAAAHGYGSRTEELDTGVGLLKGKLVTKLVIVTSSYEGQPPNNAAHFVEWLTSMSGKDKEPFNDLSYAVFGCGHSDWSSTFQRIPTLVDETLVKLGAKRLVDRGVANVADGDIFGEFDAWADKKFWPTISKAISIGDSASELRTQLEFELGFTDRAKCLRQDVDLAIVEHAMLLTAEGEPEKRHTEILLPTSVTYSPGDYLAVLPLNPRTSVEKVMRRYHMPWDANITITSKGPTTLPANSPMSVQDLLRGFVELAQPASKKDIARLHKFARSPHTRSELHVWRTSKFEAKIVGKRCSVLDILDQFPDIDLPFGDLLSMLPPMCLRHYSISSSPLADPHKCSITYGVVNAPATSSDGLFEGVTSTYLKSLKPGDSLQVAIRSTNRAFRLPVQMSRTPILMICAGTGLAPFRGFIQQRAHQLQASPDKDLAPAVLFVGCRSSEKDRLYAKELDAWIKLGAVDVRYAFSREPEHADAKGCKYVQERMLRDRDDIYAMWQRDAKVYVCGSLSLAKAVGEAARELVATRRKEVHGETMTAEEMQSWFASRKGERFVTDVFA